MDSNVPLRLDYSAIREIVKEINRKFMLHSDNISFHFDEYAIQITIFPRTGETFICPYGHVDLRLKDAKFDWIEREL